MYQTFEDVVAKPAFNNFYFITANNFENADKLCDQIGELNNLFLLVIQPFNENFSWKNINSFVEITSETFNDAGIYFYKKVCTSTNQLIVDIDTYIR